MTLNQEVAIEPQVDPGATDLDAARRVLQIEADALHALAASLEERFVAAVNQLAAVTGRVVVTGMGKSGHVGRKIAATMASTGTPALFVHPGEASHGDLGMVTEGDAVICLSNSGETAELADIIHYARRFSIPLIGIVGRPDSTLERAATVTLVLPDQPEACPMGLAPTTSSTMALALGDALAVALLERQGFSPDQYKVLHPGGRLGRKLLKVADVMHRGDTVPLIGDQAKMADALLEMTSSTFGTVGVTDAAGRLSGIITDGDLRRHLDGDLMACAVRDVMTPSPKTIGSQVLADEALALMRANRITSLFVVDSDRPVGFLNVHDLMRAGIA